MFLAVFSISPIIAAEKGQSTRKKAQKNTPCHNRWQGVSVIYLIAWILSTEVL